MSKFFKLCLGSAALAFFLCALSFNVYAASGSCGDNLKYEISDDGKILTISKIDASGSGSMHDYDSSDNTSPFYKNTGLTTLILGDGITSIGDYAFSGCSGLSGELTIPKGVTSIGNYSFENCTGLTDFLKIPDSVTRIGKEAFRYCSGLKLVDLGHITTIGDFAFAGCSGLEGDLGIPGSVATISFGAFGGCVGLTSVTIDDGVETIGNKAFVQCVGLTSITIPDSVTTIGEYAFFECYKLTGTIKITEGTKSIGKGTFYGCSGLTGNLTIPSSVTSIGDSALYGCSGLTGNLTIPSGVTSIGDSAFYGCSGLTGDLTIPNKIKIINESTFYGCSGLTSLKIPERVTSIGSKAFYGCTGLTGNFTIPNSVTSVGDSAFCGCTGLTGNFIIPNSVTSVGDSAFYGCTGLTGFTIPDSVTSIGYNTFGRCTGLTDFTIPNSVTSVGDSAFCGCTGLTGNFIIPNSVTSVGDSAFYGCTGLTGLTIPNSVNSVGYEAFRNCGYKNSIKNAEITVLNASVDTTIGADAFYNVKKLRCFEGSAAASYTQTDTTAGTAPEIVYITSSGSCGENLIYTIDEENTVIISGSGPMTNYENIIGSTDFSPFYEYGSTLTALVLEDGITSIGSYAFGDCPNLISVTIPKSVETVMDNAFYNCGYKDGSKNAVITVLSTTADIGSQSFLNVKTLKCFKNSTTDTYAADNGITSTYIQDQSSIEIKVAKPTDGKWIQKAELIITKDDGNKTAELTRYKLDNNGDYIFPVLIYANSYTEGRGLPCSLRYYYTYKNEAVNDETKLTATAATAGSDSDDKTDGSKVYYMDVPLSNAEFTIVEGDGVL